MSLVDPIPGSRRHGVRQNVVLGIELDKLQRVEVSPLGQCHLTMYVGQVRPECRGSSNDKRITAGT